MLTLAERREANRRAYRAGLQQLRVSPELKSFLTAKQGSDLFHLRPYDRRYKHQCLQILAYQFSSMSGVAHATILQLSVQDQYDALCAELDHLQVTGLGYVLLDQRQNVCVVGYDWDHADLPPPHISPRDSANSKYRKKCEINTGAMEKDSLFGKHVSSQQPLEYGRVLMMDKIAVRPDLLERGLFRIGSISFILAHAMGYKCVFALQTNPKTIAAGDAVSGLRIGAFTFKRSSYFDFSEFVFSDGSSIEECYTELGTRGLDVAKLRKHRSKIALMFIFIDTNAKAELKRWFARRSSL